MEPIVLLVNVVGWAGMLLLVAAYAAVTTSVVRPTGLAFQLMNIVGGTLLAINSAYYGAWPSVALNVVWVGVGTVGILRARHAGGDLPLRRGGRVRNARR